MGLCKCPKKRVTNQFCFEHRVNVCENCMVSEHQKCVIQSYLQWLNDSDYNPVCQLCQEDLVSRECVRLVCYDVFHKVCLNDWARKLPANTAPAGYRCPVCSTAIFPPSNLVSPVAEALKVVLASFDWAQTGLGMPLVRNSVIPPKGCDGCGEEIVQFEFGKLIGTHQNLQLDRGIPDGQDPTMVSSSPLEEFHNPILMSQHRNAAAVVSGITRKNVSSSSIHMIHSEEDSEENKYKRRPVLEWFNRWIRTFQHPSSRHHQRMVARKQIGLVLGATLFCFVILFFCFRSRSLPNEDPLLDPLNNPNIRIADE